ncbi:MAG TPA: DinB family protein [Vicinamibacterales bacterium]|nr:DinB family protein [Vicinamibacterales bacterium]
MSTQLEREVARSRKALEQMPEGKSDWKPHDKSMPFGYLAELVSIMPSWVAFQVNQDSIDLAPPDGSGIKREKKTTRADYLKALDEAAASARQALSGTNDEHLATRWQLKVRGNVVQEGRRDEMIQDTFNHLAHHRGQMTVYLRLMGSKVPAIFGPSADDTTFA